MFSIKPINYVILIISITAYFFIAYQIPRHETLQLLFSYSILFAAYLFIFFTCKNEEFDFWFYSSVILRGVVLFSIPNLSDDFYRFIWDGRLWSAGFHPFSQVPSFYMNNNCPLPGINETLYNHLNSKDYFTIYPPITQLIFFIAAKTQPHSLYGSIVVMKLFILAAEIGSIFLIRHLIKTFNLPKINTLLYALNPLIIIELTGNIHFEAVMIFFLLLFIFFLTCKKIYWASLAFALAVATKLIPLIFLPVLLLYFPPIQRFRFCISVFISIVLIFLPMYDVVIIEGYRQSLSYYFQKFEFNASIYYIVRAFGYWIYDYNIIQTVGWKLATISTVLILFYSFKISPSLSINKQDRTYRYVPYDCMWILLIYLLFASIVHPWYITPLVAFSILTTYRFTVIWSLLIFFSYAGYTVNQFNENIWITSLEYFFVFTYLLYELWKTRHATMTY